ELEVAGEIPAEAPEKSPAEYGIVGTNVPRLELPAKIAGKPSYVHDMVLPGMLHARVLRPPRPFAKLVSIPDHPGLVRNGSFAAVTAAREEEVVDAAKKLAAKAVWSEGPKTPEDIYGW